MGIHLYFEYGGRYDKMDDGGGFVWVSKEDHMYSLLFRHFTASEITYGMVTDHVCKKVGADPSTTQLRLSFMPLDAKPPKQSYIRDDDDVYVYLTSTDSSKCRSVLHVEVIVDSGVVPRGKDLNKSKGVASTSRVDDASSFGVNYELVPRSEDGGGEQEERGEAVSSGSEDTIHGRALEHDFYEDPYYDEANGERHHSANEWHDGMDLRVGQEFSGRKELRDFLEKGARLGKFSTTTVKSDSHRYRVRCRLWSQGCKWYVNASKVRGSSSFRVSVYRSMHSCSFASATATMESRSRGTGALVSSYIGKYYPSVRNAPTAKDLIEKVWSTYGVTPSYSTCWRGKQKAMNKLRGDPEKGFRDVYSYLHMLKSVNHGTKTEVKLDDKGCFEYLFVALGACIEGFKCMRQVLVVDGTFLKSGYKGVLLLATAQDPNRHTFPVAFAVVDGETNAGWKWFFEQLKTVVPDHQNLVFVSDRNYSLIQAVQQVYPLSMHGFCIFHISLNVKLHVRHTNKEEVSRLFREVAQIYTVPEFTRRYEDYRTRYPSVAEYLDDSLHYTRWARCHFPGARYNIDTTNSVESLNNVLNKAREYNLLPMIDLIVEKTAEWFNKHRKETVGYNVMLAPFVEKELSGRCKDAKYLPVMELNLTTLEFSVRGQDGVSYFVSLVRRSCSCRTFDIDRYPCVHAIAALYHYMAIPAENRTYSLEVHHLCDQYYYAALWIKAYSRTIYLVPDNREWDIPDEVAALCALPPEYKSSRGRRQKRRRPSKGEAQPRKKRVRGSESQGEGSEREGEGT